MVFPWDLWVWLYVLVREQCRSYQSIFHRWNLDILCAGRMRTCHLYRAMPVAWWPTCGQVCVGLDPGTGGKERKCRFLIFQAGCAFPSPIYQLSNVGAGKGLRSLALPHVNAAKHFFSWGHNVGDGWDLCHGVRRSLSFLVHLALSQLSDCHLRGTGRWVVAGLGNGAVLALQAVRCFWMTPVGSGWLLPLMRP